MRAWWFRRSQAERFELYIRVSFYSYVLVSPFFAGGLVHADVGIGESWVVAALTVVHTGVCLLLLRAGIDHYIGLRPKPIGLVAAGAALTAGGVGLALAVYPGPTPGRLAGPATAVLIVLAGSYVAALCTAVRLRSSLAAAVACTGALVLGGDPRAAVVLGTLLTGIVLANRVSLWMLGVVRELDRARHVQAGLAVAEERLRFARDLHDVVGRTLSVVSLKAELAAQLAKRGRDEAVDEMLEVRRIAQESLAELRSLVGGYRAADLTTELAGARALLASAGIECRVIGDGAGLPEAVQGILGWVVREGTTNMLRHSDARSCTVTLRTGPAAVTLTMENDGVMPRQDRVRFGGGLVGLTERVTGLGGTVTAGFLSQGGFRLAVELPPSIVDASAAAGTVAIA
ncbi:histidine kinase [Dactylosporangium fulvum]|uniref:Histidine kinase n=1 Tax=Dactylosporangium fulvum TaxID=53359 RepID=A0ABY5WA04_9ACTN|nr:histidine kinase [Dactylosporangium fulvum]UWP86319.1 histidine kinase [Dactylosporangium fulvum]